MLPVNIIIPQDEEQMALALNGKKRNIRKKDFMIFAGNSGISDKAAEKMIKKLCALKERYMEQCELSYLTDELKDKTKELILQRIQILM